MPLKLTRRRRESLVIYTEKGTAIEVQVLASYRRRTVISIQAPREIRIFRGELLNRKATKE